MIVKPYVPRSETDPRRAAGVAAERRMAHYLDRHFADDKDMHVLHDVRLEFEGDVAQLDHLVVHPFGVAIVESKSVTTSVRINASDEWERRARGRWSGMPNPLLQAERQGILLQRLLMSRTGDLLDKVVFGLLQGTFRQMAIDVFAAISDGGTIQRSRRDQAPQASKADAVPNAIVEQVRAHRRAASILNPNLRSFNDAPRDFKPAEVLRVAHFLRTRADATAEGPVLADAAPARAERPRVGRAGPRATTRATRREASPNGDERRRDLNPAPRERLACKACGGHDLEAKIGRYGPYGACLACGTNTAIRRTCSTCNERIRLERSDDGFAGRCGTCGAEHVVQVSTARGQATRP